jgi:predicted  nucleic acid-binding Zn-ribbon protein
LKEIEDLKKKMSAMEDDMLLVLEQIDHLESLVSEKKKETETLSQKIDMDKKAIQTEAEESNGGKSEHQRAGCSITWSRGNVKESATESIPPSLEAG